MTTLEKSEHMAIPYVTSRDEPSHELSKSVGKFLVGDERRAMMEGGGKIKV